MSTTRQANIRGWRLELPGKQYHNLGSVGKDTRILIGSHPIIVDAAPSLVCAPKLGSVTRNRQWATIVINVNEIASMSWVVLSVM